MRGEIKFDGRLMSGPAPSEERLKQLAHRQFQTVIDLRTKGELEDRETGKLRTHRWERGDHALVERLGMDYVNIPVPEEKVKTRQFEAFRQEFDRHGHPVYVYSNKGMRAAIFSFLIKAIDEQMDVQAALEAAREKGIRFNTPEEEEFFKEYVTNCVPEHGG